VQCLGLFGTINASEFSLKRFVRTAQPAFKYNAKMRRSTICQ
jgi:hypothetical protein